MENSPSFKKDETSKDRNVQTPVANKNDEANKQSSIDRNEKK